MNHHYAYMYAQLCFYMNLEKDNKSYYLGFENSVFYSVSAIEPKPVRFIPTIWSQLMH